MRHKVPQSKYKEGDTRVIKTFLILPRRIGNEWRWFEKAYIKQRFRHMWDVTCGGQWDEWISIKWVNK